MRHEGPKLSNLATHALAKSLRLPVNNDLKNITKKTIVSDGSG